MSRRRPQLVQSRPPVIVPETPASKKEQLNSTINVVLVIGFVCVAFWMYEQYRIRQTENENMCALETYELNPLDGTQHINPENATIVANDSGFGYIE